MIFPKVPREFQVIQDENGIWQFEIKIKILGLIARVPMPDNFWTYDEERQRYWSARVKEKAEQELSHIYRESKKSGQALAADIAKKKGLIDSATLS